MKRYLIITVLSIVWTIGIAVTDATAQTAYGISIVRYNASTRIVDGYSGTWLDYYAGLYYDPEVIGDLYRTDMNETSLDHGRSVGYANTIPAEVSLSTTNFVEGKLTAHSANTPYMATIIMFKADSGLTLSGTVLSSARVGALGPDIRLVITTRFLTVTSWALRKLALRFPYHRHQLLHQLRRRHQPHVIPLC